MAIPSLETILSSDGSQFVETVKSAREQTKLFNEALLDGKRVFDATRTPAEKYETEISKLNNLLKQGAISQDTHARAVKQAGTSFGQASGGLGQFSSLLPPAVSGLTAMGGPLAAAFIGLKAIGLGFDLAVGAGKAFVDLVSAGFENVDKIDKLSSRIGITADSLLALQHAARLADVDSESLTNGIEKLQVNIGKAAIEGGSAAKAFDRLGLDAKKMATQGVDKNLAEIADKLAAIESPAERAAAAAGLFGGKLGKEMVSLLGGGSAALREAKEEAELLGQTLSEFDKSQVDEASKSWDRINAAVEGLGMQLAVEVAPAVKLAADTLLDVLKHFGGITPLAKELAGYMMATAEVAGNLAHLSASPGAIVGLMAGGELMGTQMRRAIQDAQLKSAIEFQSRPPEAPGGTLVDDDDDAESKADKLKQAIDRQVKSLKEQAYGIGKSREELELWKLKQDGANTTQLEAVEAAQQELAAKKAVADWTERQTKIQEEDAKKLAKLKETLADNLRKQVEKDAAAGQKIIDQNMTDQERYQAALKDVEKLKQVGAIDQKTFDREKARLDKQLADSKKPKAAAPLTPQDRAISALERGSSAAFSAINRAANQQADRQLAVAQQQLQVQQGLAVGIAAAFGGVIGGILPVPVTIPG